MTRLFRQVAIDEVFRWHGRIYKKVGQNTAKCYDVLREITYGVEFSMSLEAIVQVIE